jgi:transposase, IS30 family
VGAMIAYTRLTAEDRFKIEALWAAGQLMSQIAVILDRARSTITAEIRRHGVYRYSAAAGAINPRSVAMKSHCRGLYGFKYDARRAHRHALRDAPLRRSRAAAGPRKLDAGPLREAVLQGVRDRWSPRQISQRLARDHAGAADAAQWSVSHETIYQALYLQSRGSLREELKDQVALRSGRKRRRRTPVAAGPVRSGRPWTTDWNISQRPAEADDRAVPGHWEGDLIIGKGGKSAIITCVERSTRFVLLGALPDGRDSLNVTDVLTTLISRLPTLLRRSLAWDNGSELARAAEFTIATGCPVYFADPHSPWQRGSNENTNGLLRQYFPKHTFDFNTINQNDLDAVAAQLNGRPRQTLGWDKPAERLNALLLR